MDLVWGNFFMVLGRLSGLFLIAPIFANRQLPGRLKILILILLAAAMSSFVPINLAVSLNNPVIFIAAFAAEVFIGFAIGFVAYVFFAAVQLAGQLMDTQMGFGIVNVMDPLSGLQIPLMGNFNYLMALMIYLGMDGHHYLLQAVAQSYQVIPVLGANFSRGFIDIIVSVTAYMVVIAVKIAAPIVMAVLITDISMGYISRTVPQMNVFMVGLPLKILVGMLAFILIMPVYIWFFSLLLGQSMDYIDLIVQALGL